MASGAVDRSQRARAVPAVGAGRSRGVDRYVTDTGVLGRKEGSKKGVWGAVGWQDYAQLCKVPL